MSNLIGDYVAISTNEAEDIIISCGRGQYFVGIDTTTDIGKKVVDKVINVVGYYLDGDKTIYESKEVEVVSRVKARFVTSGNELMIGSVKDFIKLPYVYKRGVNIIYGSKEELSMLHLKPANIVLVENTYYVDTDYEDNSQKELITNLYDKNKVWYTTHAI